MKRYLAAICFLLMVLFCHAQWCKADEIAPTIQITGPSSEPVYPTTASTVTISGMASDNVEVTKVTCNVSGSGLTIILSGTTTWETPNLMLPTDRNFIVTCTALDAAGNKATDSITIVRPDTVAPTIQITSPTSGPTYSTNLTSVTISGIAYDNVGVTQVFYTMNDDPTQYTVWSLPEGEEAPKQYLYSSSKTLQCPSKDIYHYYSGDEAGNTSNAAELTITCDNVKPVIQITLPTTYPSYDTPSSPVTLSGTASDNEGVTLVTCTKGSAKYPVAGTDNWSSTAGLKDGDNVFIVTAYDEAGNEAKDSIKVTYDAPETDPPTIQITGPTSDPTYTTYSSSVTLSGTAWDQVGVTQVTCTKGETSYSVNGTTAWSSTVPLSIGLNVFTVTAFDAAGNQRTDTIAITLPDVDPPSIQITGPTSDPTYTTYSSSVTLSGTAWDQVGVTQVTCTKGETSYSVNGTTAWSSTVPLSIGLNVFTVTAFDAAGHQRTGSITVTRRTQPTTFLDQVQKCYIGYYQRPADPGGLLWWAEELKAVNGDLSSIINAFAKSDESRALYGEVNNGTISIIVDGIYMGLLSRTASQLENDYWSGLFKEGKISAAAIMLIMLNGAQNEDFVTIDNKVTTANLFTQTIDPELDGENLQATYEGQDDAEAARAFLNQVNGKSAVPTLSKTRDYIKEFIADPGDPILNQ